MKYVQMTLSDWIEMKQKLRQELMGVTRSFVRIGYALRKIEEQRLYEQDGYKSVAEFAKAEYGLEQSTTSRFMSINREYSIDGYSEHLRPEYADLGRSQLEEMLKLPDSDRKMIQAETPRADIRELKRFNKEEPAAGVADDIAQLIEKFFEQNPETLNEIFNKPELKEENIEHLVELVNPGGNRSYRKGFYFMMMYEKRIVIKKFGETPKEMSWWEFYQKIMEIFGAAAGPNTWKNYFGTEEETGEEKQVFTEKEIPEKEETEEEKEEKREEPEQKKKYAPAQKTAERLEKEAQDEKKNTEENRITENISTEPEPEEAGTQKQETEEEKTESGITAMNPPEIVEKPFGTRKDYMDTLTAYGTAQYIAEEYRRGNITGTDLNQPEKLEKWLTQEVDEKGWNIEE